MDASVATSEVHVDEGAGPAIVLIHGVAADSRVWDRTTAYLTPHCRVLTVDLPGLSLRSLGSAPLTPQAYGESVARAMADRGIDRYSIVGHSYGASVGLVCAQRHAARVDCVTAIAPGGFGPEINPFLRLMTSRTGASVLRLTQARAVRKRVRRGAERYRRSARATESIEELLDVYGRLETKDARRVFRQSITAVMDARREYSNTSVAAPLPPVQVIWGDNDLVLPVWQSEQAARALKAESVHLIPGAGHAPHRTHPQLLAGFIREFCITHAPPAEPPVPPPGAERQ